MQVVPVAISRWYVRASDIGLRYAQMWAKLNRLIDDKDGRFATLAYTLDEAVKTAVISGSLRVSNGTGGPLMEPGESAYAIGMLNLQRFCDWSPSVIDDCPTRAQDLAEALGLALSIDSPPSERGAANAAHSLATEHEGIPHFVTKARPTEVPTGLLALPADARISYEHSIGRQRGSGVTNAGDYRDSIRETIARQSEGYFTLNEAAQVLADNRPGLDPIETVKRFKLAHSKGNLAIHHHGSRFPLEVGETIRDFLDTVHVSELDVWLRASAGYGFPTVALSDNDAPIEFQSPRAFKPWESLRAPEAHIAGLYFYHQAAREIADANGWTDGQLQALLEAMATSLNAGSLRTRDRKSGLVRHPPNLDMLLLVTPEDVNDWLSAQGAPYRWTQFAQENNAASANVTKTVAVPEAGALPQDPMERRARLLDWFRAAGGKRLSEGGRGTRGALAAVVRKSGIDKDTLGAMLDKAIEERRMADAFAALGAAKR